MLGAGVVRVFVPWASFAPSRDARTRPSDFDATDPAAYPNGAWDRLDQVDRDARLEGLTLDFVLTGGAPRWADGGGIPRQIIGNLNRAWRPSMPQFGQFVAAVGARYSGTYPDPQDSGDTLPRVHFWSIWNEPNFGEDLAPEAIDGSTVPLAPTMYRRILDTAWTALHATGHGHDTILIGELAAGGSARKATRAHPQGLPGDFAQTKPVAFLQDLYCLSPRYRQLRGARARALGCPTTPGGSGRFRGAHPGLFAATGISDHPYAGASAPDARISSDPDFASFPDLHRFAQDFDRIQRSYGARRQMPIYSDEFGYITHPPNTGAYVSPATAGYYLNWSEYLSWRNPRIASTMQYLLYDPTLAPHTGAFTTGLLAPDGREKPAYVSYRMPLYLPVTGFRPERALEVWACVRPAHSAALDTGEPQIAEIQFRPENGGGPFRTIATAPVTNPRGYLDVHVRFPGSGTVRIAWTYPQTDPFMTPQALGTTIESRTVRVSAR
jgi:hypothetical protein